MEAKELRIGNYLIHDGYFIKSYSVDGFINVIKNIDNYEPIPLTEEWLVKFGWGKSNEHELCDNSNDIVFVYDWHFKRFEIQIDTEHVGVEYRLYHIKYVHKLQNLYFALTNKELTIKQ